MNLSPSSYHRCLLLHCTCGTTRSGTHVHCNLCGGPADSDNGLDRGGEVKAFIVLHITALIGGSARATNSDLFCHWSLAFDRQLRLSGAKTQKDNSAHHPSQGAEVAGFLAGYNMA